MLLRFMAVGLAATVCLSCSDSNDQAGVSAAQAQALAEAMTLEAEDLGPDFVDYTSGLSEQVNLAECTPGDPVLAQTAGRSLGTEAKGATGEAGQQIIIKSLVYESDDIAGSALATLEEHFTSEMSSDAPCIDSTEDPLQFRASDESPPSADEAVVLVAPNELTIILLRNGPTVSLLLPLFGSIEDNRPLISNVADKLAAAVANRS